MLTLLIWGVLKHIWNMECFAHSPPREAPHENITIVVTKDCAATNSLRLHNKALVAQSYAT